MATPMILYHFPTSPFARRVRLALAHKGLSAELRDARASDEHRAEVQRLNPVHTVPVLVDSDRVVTDSMAILHYLDRKVPNPPLWPPGVEGAEAFELIALTDSMLSVLVDLGTRYHALHDHAQFETIRREHVGRGQRALDRLADKAKTRSNGAPLCGDRWSAADMVVYSATNWLEGLPARASAFLPAKQILSLGWSVPASLAAWADRQRGRDDVRALG